MQPIVTDIDIQNIVRATLDQMLPSSLEQVLPSIVSQTLSSILAALQELTAPLASIEDDRPPHKRTPTTAEDSDSMQMHNTALAPYPPHLRKSLIVWQWNCRGLRRKKSPLLQHMKLVVQDA
ncbi:hypothetical protein HPB48_006495 [Haemaphysalis longicornis]|uniref:Uncharacterized protein n=1 Tax=Haemaphysalis longicornis TaxID=44386 RepID=A0A9J6GA46_HAELO|nr:hypothetical protein HPB48_006495 [Haemaphysalis longicornis]